MFSKPRPVPSKAALKFLYQLAYISSGTAVGVATLCAEERRRRTHIVQKIADNSKRLRQSPRHVHNAAALAERDEDYGHQYQVQSSAGVTEVDHGSFARKRYSPLASRSAHAPDLPSFVERGYGQLVETDYKCPRRRRSGAALLDEERSSRRKSERTISHPAEGQRAATSIARGSKDRNALKPASEPRNKLLKETIGSALDRAPIPSELPPDSSFEGQDDAQYLTRSAAASQQPAIKDNTPSTLNAAPIFAEPPTEQSVDKQDDGNLPRREMISPPQSQRRAVNFGQETRADEPRLANMVDHSSNPSVVSRVDVAPLFEHAIHTNDNILKIRSLIESKSSRSLLTASDIQVICENAHTLATRFRHGDAFRLYARLVEIPAYMHLPCADRIYCALTVLVEAIHWDLAVTTDTVVKVLLPPRPWSDTDTECFSVTLSGVCEELISKGRVISAFDLIKACRQSTKAVHLFPAEDTVSRALLDSGLLDRCARLLKARMRDEYIDRFKPHIERLATACHQARNHGALAACIGQGRSGINGQLLKLNDEARTAIATALASTKRHPAGLFLAFYHSVPKQKRRAIDEARTCARLRDLWKATRDFDSIWDHYISAKTFATSQHLSVDALRNMELTMVEICNSANRPDRALEMLSGTGTNSSHSPRSLCIAAVALAKKKSWQQLEDFLRLLEISRAFNSAKPNHRALNNVIHLYSQSHSAVDTWKFVTGLVQKLHFSPNKTTSTIMLQCFVSKRALELVPQWLRFMGTLGSTIRMDPGIAADLLKSYYLEQRPPHALLRDLCSDLVREVPAFNTEQLRNLLIEATSYDLRNNNVKDRQKLQEKAKKNMAIVFADGVPTPVSRDLKSSGQPGVSSLSSADGIPPPALQARNNPSLAANALYLPSNSSGASAWRTDEDMQAEHTTVQTTDDTGSLRDSFGDFTTSSHTSDEHAYGLAAQRKEAERAAEQSMQQLFQDFNSDELDESVGADPLPVPLSDGGRDTNDSRLNILRDATNVAGSRASASETSGLSAHDRTDELLDDETEDKLVHTHNQRHQQRLVRDMLAAFSLQEYPRVVELFHGSKSAEGLPASPIALEICIEASLRAQRGNPAEANAIMSAARDAGMDVTCARAPMLLHQMWHSDIADQRNADLLRLTTIDYYRTNAENGWPVKHHVGVTAANILVNKGLPEHGISILNNIYHSEWAQDRGFDVVVMSVYLRAYAALGSDKGLKWTLSTVLREQMRIDRKFLDTLRRAREIYSDAIKHESASRRTSNYLAPLRRWRVIDSDMRTGLEWKLFGVPERLDVPAHDPADRLASKVAEGHISRATGRRTAGRTHRIYRDLKEDTWIEDHRNFVKTEVQMPDGKLASFQYSVDDEKAPGQPAKGQADDVRPAGIAARPPR